MNDPHVEALHYTVGTASNRISYGSPPPLEFENEIGKFRLADGALSVTPAEHFPDQESALQLIDPYLRAWEVQTDVTANVGQIRFTFQRASVIDRCPPPPGTKRVVEARGAASIGVFSVRAEASITCNRYADPPYKFRASPEVEMAHARWVMWREGRESLQSMAYFVLTLIEHQAGGRKSAATQFQIEYDVLRKVGDLSSTRGDATTARKARHAPMTGSERSWLEAATRKLIVRMGEYAAGNVVEQITFSGLPHLN